MPNPSQNLTRTQTTELAATVKQHIGRACDLLELIANSYTRAIANSTMGLTDSQIHDSCVSYGKVCNDLKSKLNTFGIAFESDIKNRAEAIASKDTKMKADLEEHTTGIKNIGQNVEGTKNNYTA